MAPGPNVIINKKEIIFGEEESQENDDDDPQPYQYYESDKILGVLYRAIDERDVFKEVQHKPTQDSRSMVMRNAWVHVQYLCNGIQWEHLKDWARDIRDMSGSI